MKMKLLPGRNMAPAFARAPMPDIALTPPPIVNPCTPVQVTWAGNPWSLFKLCLLNTFLIVITGGIYWFWARAEYRRHMWKMVRVNGEPLEYIGTGKELLIGYLKLFLLIILPAFILVMGSEFALGSGELIGQLISVGFFYLYFVGYFRAHRYVLSRTRWRGIALGLGGDAIGYAWTSLWTALVGMLTLGWIFPWRTMVLRRRLASAMRFGTMPLSFEGKSASLYRPFAFFWISAVLAFAAVSMAAAIAQQAQDDAAIPYSLLWALPATIPLALIGYSWYEARKLARFAQATKFGSLSGTLEASGGSVLWLTLSNVIILVLSAGVLRPIVQARRLRYIVTRFSFTGSENLSEIGPAAGHTGSQGAGLEAAFSIEIF